MCYYSWYFGPMSRTEATDLLMKEREGGVFLVRDSTTILGDYVLCVRYEDNEKTMYDWMENVLRWENVQTKFIIKHMLKMNEWFIQIFHFLNISSFREDTKVSHYIINKIQQADHIVYRIGDQSFADLPELLTFYKLHYLDTTPLRRPAQKKHEKVIGKFDFEANVSCCLIKI
jgi:C-crk adapter molecule crk